MPATFPLVPKLSLGTRAGLDAKPAGIGQTALDFLACFFVSYAAEHRGFGQGGPGMSEEKPSSVTGTVGGWIKAAVTSVVGLVSGAFLMYLTPVVNNAIKPGKPVANFAIQPAGLEVNFNNRSTGGVQGWWDFGDGAALEPFDPKLENVKHVYAKPGTYSVKLSLQNLLGEESDRTAAVTIDAGGAVGGPEIASFDLKPLDPRERAPAVYRLTGKVKNANLCILSYGDSKPTEIIDDALNHERYITFDETGAYTVRLTA